MKGSNIMAKNTTPEQERVEQEFRNRINGIVKERTDELQANVKAAMEKATEEAKRNRKRKMAHEVLCCIAAVACIVGLYAAETAGLISPVLTAPANAFAFAALGWHLCKADRVRGRK